MVKSVPQKILKDLCSFFVVRESDGGFIGTKYFSINLNIFVNNQKNKYNSDHSECIYDFKF